MEYFIPTIVFFSPDVPADSMYFIQENIKSRLGEKSDLLMQFEQFHPQMDKNQITDILRRITSQDYWTQLIAKEFFSDDFLLDDTVSKKVNLVFITNHLNADSARSHFDYLSEFLKAYAKKLCDMINPTISLICVGKYIPDSQLCKQLWPRIHLSDTNQAKLRVDGWKYYQETVANLIMGFVATDLIASIPENLKKSEGWLIFGASSVIVDLGMMKKYMLHRLSRILTDKLISEPPSTQEQSHIKRTVEKHLITESSKVANLNQGLLREDFDSDYQPPVFSKVDLKNKSEYRKIINSPADSAESLARLYQLLQIKTKKVLEQDASRQYESHIRFIGNLIDKQYGTSDISGVLSSDQPKYQIGLRTALYALRHWENCSGKIPGKIIFNRSVLKSFPVSGQKGIKQITQADIRNLKESKSILDNYQQKLGNITGTLLLITPLIPILAEFIRRRYLNSSLLAFLIAIIGIGLVGAIPYIYFRGILLQRKREYTFVAESRLTESCLRFLAHNNRVMQKIIFKKICSIKINLENIVCGLDRLRAYIKGELIRASKNKDLDINKETVSIYEMADYDKCDNWINQAQEFMKSEREHGRDFTREFLTDQLFPNIFSNGSALPVYMLVFQKANELIDKYFQPDYLHTYQLAFNMSDLSEGKLWRWLQKSAVPLGVRMADDNEIVTILSIRDSVEDRAALAGAYGETNEYYPVNAHLIDASLSYEINCFRFFIQS